MIPQILERGFKLTTKPDYTPVCAICGEVPADPVRVTVKPFNIEKQCCKQCLEDL